MHIGKLFGVNILWIIGVAIAAIIIFSIVITKPNNMTFRQSILQKLYHVIMWAGKLGLGKTDIQEKNPPVTPSVSPYSISITDSRGETLSLSSFKGKKILIVNTASDCGYTGQYAELEQLHQQAGDKLVILAFPANDFKEQESGTDQEIQNFCQINYGLSFPVMKKTSVVQGSNQSALFKWLSDPQQNGWCQQQPVWNFCKYIINEEGQLTYFFSQKVSPLDSKLIQAVTQ
jgi:glutathione peroxidase